MPADQPPPRTPPRSGEEQRHRNAVYEAIGLAATSLVRSSSTEKVIPALIERLGHTLGVSRIVLDRYLPGPDGEVLAETLAYWRAPDQPLPAEVPVGRSVPLRGLGFDLWLEKLENGDLVEGRPEDFPGPVGDMLRIWNVRTFLAVPIVMEKRLTGLLSLAECHEPRAWLQPETDALRIYAGIIGSFLHRLESDRALRQSEERYRQVVESSNDYVWEVDGEGRLTYCSDRVRDILGYAPEEMVGKTPADFLPPADQESGGAGIRATMASGESFDIQEYRLLSATGKIICFSTRGGPIRDESGTLIGYRGVSTNITARKHAESVLRASEERYRGLVESQRHLIIRWTPDYRLVFANEAYYRYFGLDRQAVLGQPIAQTAPAELSEATHDLLRTLSTPPFHVAHERQVTTVHGHRWISWESFAIRDDESRIIEIQAMGRDVTHERLAAGELLRRDRILAAVNTAAEHLLGSSHWETVIEGVMERLGQATGAGRVRFWEICTLEGGRRALALRTGWEADGGAPNTAPRQDGPFYLDEPEFVRFIGSETNLRSATFETHEVPAPVAAMLRERGFKGFLAVPVLVNGAWWGLMTITHDEGSVPWSSGEEEALRTASGILGAAIHRQQIETSLRESEEKYRTLVEGAHQPIIIVGHDAVVRFSNEFAAAALNLTATQMVGRSMWDLFPREHADSHMRAIRRAVDSGRQVVSTHRSVVRGRPGWYEARIQPLAGSWNEQRAALVIISDISERKEAERRILEYQSRLRSLSSELALAEQRERRRIASELHDRIGQSLAMARIKLGGIEPNGIDGAWDEVRALLDQSIQDTRTLTFELSPPILHELGLEPALEWLLERFAARHSFSTSFHGDGLPVDLPGDVLGLVFQSVQELLVNVAKHARARTVEITLDRGDGILHLEVVDDGIGTTPPRAPRTGRSPEGFGLFSIRERIEQLGGSFLIDSQPGKGTRAYLRVPLRTPTPSKRRKGQP